MDARIDALIAADPYDNFRDGNTARIATFSETNRNGAPEFTAEICRMERSFTNKLESLYRRVDNRINSLAHRNQITRPELAENRERSRQSKPVCYKCGRGRAAMTHVIAALPKKENTTSQEADVNIPSSNQKVKLTVTNQRQSQIMPKQGQCYKRNRREMKSSVQQSNVFLSRRSDAKLTSHDLTTVGKIAGQAVQLLVDTGACVSAIDKQFFTKIYGQFPPKMSDCSLSSIQAVGGGTVQVLGKITVPLQLNGCKYPCDFHVMQNLTCDAILGRDFLQANKALIDLDNSSITFKKTGHAGKATSATTLRPVMRTCLPQQHKLKENNTVATHVETSIESNCQLIPRSRKNKALGFQQPLLVLMLIILYLLTASCTPHTTDHAKPVIQNMPKFFVPRTPDDKVEDGQANREGTAQSLVPKEEKGERIKVLQSRDAQKTLKTDYSSPPTVLSDLEEDATKNVFDTMRAHLGNEVSRY
ncbi:hypothetical protein ACROYT_G040931 [Oculina patagonica]